MPKKSETIVIHCEPELKQVFDALSLIKDTTPSQLCRRILKKYTDDKCRKDRLLHPVLAEYRTIRTLGTEDVESENEQI